MIHSDDFRHGLSRWSSELEKGGRVEASDGTLVIDVPGGCTVWFNPLLEGPLEIRYEATVVSAGGKNDRVSDLNCFWMARDARSPDDLFATRRSGRFADYNPLIGYYVGYGGNANTTTRFRRYIGDLELRPLLPEHDLRDPPHLLEPNRTYRIRLVADGSTIQFWRDDECVFDFHDPHPYTSGWFGFRTVASHLRIERFEVLRRPAR